MSSYICPFQLLRSTIFKIATNSATPHRKMKNSSISRARYAICTIKVPLSTNPRVKKVKESILFSYEVILILKSKMAISSYKNTKYYISLE